MQKQLLFFLIQDSKNNKASFKTFYWTNFWQFVSILLHGLVMLILIIEHSWSLNLFGKHLPFLLHVFLQMIPLIFTWLIVLKRALNCHWIFKQKLIAIMHLINLTIFLKLKKLQSLLHNFLLYKHRIIDILFLKYNLYLINDFHELYLGIICLCFLMAFYQLQSVWPYCIVGPSKQINDLLIIHFINYKCFYTVLLSCWCHADY